MRIGTNASYTFGSKIDVTSPGTRNAFTEIIGSNPNVHPNRVEEVLIDNVMADGYDHIIRFIQGRDKRYAIKITEVKPGGKKGLTTLVDPIPFVNPEDCFVHAFTNHTTQDYIDRERGRFRAIA